jgi:hypothetical protein
VEVANIYDNGPISPVARIKDKIAVWTEKKYIPYQIDFIEPIPSSSPYTIDMVTVGGVNNIPGAGQVAKSVVAVLQTNDKELLHLRWEPVDDVEGAIWQLGNMARFAPRGGQARVSLFTHLRDPWLATTTFFILGRDKDINLGAFNPQAVAQATARFAFWGYRYVLTGPMSDQALSQPITYLPAQGM